jgi:hypothetical protein
MVKKPVCLAQRPVKTSKNIEVRNFCVHGAKIGENFEFRMFDFEIVLIRFQKVKMI